MNPDLTLPSVLGPASGALVGPAAIGALAVQYLKLQDEIEAAEIAAGALKDQIKAGLDGAAVGYVFAYETCKVQVVKGRVLERLDRGKLVAQGVSAAIMEKATTRTECEPTLRITKVAV